MTPRTVAKIAWLLILTGLGMNRAIEHYYPTPALLHSELSRPVLALELVPDGTALGRLLGRDPSQYPELGIDPGSIHVADIHGVLLWSTVADSVLFIPLYVAFLIGFVKLTCGEGAVWRLALALAVIAGLADYLENSGIFRVLIGNVMLDDRAAAWIRVPALVKWAALHGTLLVLALRFIRTYGAPLFPKAGGGVLALLLLAAALIGIAGLRVYAYLELSVALFSVLVLICGVALWRPAPRREEQRVPQPA